MVKCFCLEISEIVLVHGNIANNNYEQTSRPLYTFDLNILFGQLLDIWLQKFISKTFESKFSYIEVWFPNQSFNSLDVKNRTNINLVIS